MLLTNGGTAPSKTALAGRQQELALIREHFQRSAAGQTTVVLLAGEPGVGKTRLLAETAALVTAEGGLVLRGGASEAEGMPPYLPFLEALGDYVRSADIEVLRGQVAAAAPVLATLLPELAARLGGAANAYSGPPEQARLRLYEAVGMFLAAIAAHRPLTIILDDLQWADSATLDLLTHTAGRQPAARLLLLGAYRPGEVALNPPLQRAIASLNRLRVLIPINLQPLTLGDLAVLASSYLGGPAGSVAAEVLHTQSEGNPFFAEELLRSWLENGALVEQRGAWTLLGPPEAAPLPSITAVVAERLRRLDPAVVGLLHTAAIVGRTFSAAFLAEVAGEDAELVEERLLAAAAAGLLRPGPGDVFSFSHDKIRECLYDAVSSSRRKRLHGFIGRVLEARPDGSSQHLSDLAFHFANSGDHERGASYAIAAADQAMSTWAAPEALAHYTRALELLHPDDARRGLLLLQCGEAAILASNEQEARRVFMLAQAWFAAAQDRTGAALAAHGLGRACMRLELHAAARAALDDALQLLAGGDGPARVRVLVDLCELLALSLGQAAAAAGYGRAALLLAEQLDDGQLQALANRAVGTVLVRSADIATGLPLLERALDLSIAADDHAAAAECCAALATGYYFGGDIERSRVATYRRMEFARRSHEAYQLRHIYTWLALLDLDQGRLVAAAELLEQARTMVEPLASPEPLAFYHIAWTALYYLRGDYDSAELAYARAFELLRDLGPGTLIWYFWAYPMLLLLTGQHAAARAALGELDDLIAGQPAGFATLTGRLHKAYLALLLGDAELAAQERASLEPYAGLHDDFLFNRVLGEIALLGGDWPAAGRYLAAAEEQARQHMLLPELGRTLFAQAKLQLAAGNAAASERARRLLEDARALFAQIGMSADLAQTEAALTALPQRRGRKPGAGGPAGLSERELDVLRLVARGLSNREIAAQLALSEKTVGNHLSNIFGKIDAENRAAAAAFAVRHGLA